jgi:transcriptional regulator with XRE-family HTH domain
MANRFPARQRRARIYLREWREEAGLTQDQLADRIETLSGYRMSKAQISRIELGKQPYSQDFLETAAEALGTDAASLLMRNPQRDGEAIWSLWDSAKPGERKMIVDIAKTVLKTGT